MCPVENSKMSMYVHAQLHSLLLLQSAIKVHLLELIVTELDTNGALEWFTQCISKQQVLSDKCNNLCL